MKSFLTTKDEFTVLFSLLGERNIPTSLLNYNNISEKHKSAIIKNFAHKGLIKLLKNGIAFDKGLISFLGPIIKSEEVVMINYKYSDKAKSNSTIYISNQSIVGLIDLGNMVSYIKFENFREISLHLPLLNNSDELSYLSYIIVNEDIQVSHCAISKASNIVKVTEITSLSEKILEQKTKELDFKEYREFFIRKMEEIFNVFSY